MQATPSTTKQQDTQEAFPQVDTRLTTRIAPQTNMRANQKATDLACIPADTTNERIEKMQNVTPQNPDTDFSSTLKVRLSGQQVPVNADGTTTDPQNLKGSSWYHIYNWKHADFVATNYDVPQSERDQHPNTTYYSLNKSDSDQESALQLGNLLHTHALTLNVTTEMLHLDQKYQTGLSETESGKPPIPLTWYYHIPFAKDDIEASSLAAKDIVTKDASGNDVIIGHSQIVTRCGSDDLVMRISIEEDHVNDVLNKQGDKGVWMNLSFSIDLLPGNPHRDTGAHGIQLDGVDKTLDLDWVERSAVNQKNCKRENDVMSCDARIDVFSDSLKNVTITDNATGMRINKNSIYFYAGYQWNSSIGSVANYSFQTAKWENKVSYYSTHPTKSKMQQILDKTHVGKLTCTDERDGTCSGFSFHADELSYVDVYNNGSPVSDIEWIVHYTFKLDDDLIYSNGKYYKGKENFDKKIEYPLTNNFGWAAESNGRKYSKALSYKVPNVLPQRGTPYLNKSGSQNTDGDKVNYTLRINDDFYSTAYFMDGFEIKDEMSFGQTFDPETFVLKNYLHSAKNFNFKEQCEADKNSTDDGIYCRVKEDGSGEYANPQYGTMTWTNKGFTFTLPSGTGTAEIYVTYSGKLKMVDYNGKQVPEPCTVSNTARVQWLDPATNMYRYARSGSKRVWLANSKCATGYMVTASKTNAQREGNQWNETDKGDNEYTIHEYGENKLLIPWKIELDAKAYTDYQRNMYEANGLTEPAGGFGLDSLVLKEDWVNGDSDGNTLHMWYSKNTLHPTITMDDQVLEAGKDYTVYANMSTSYNDEISHGGYSWSSTRSRTLDSVDDGTDADGTDAYPEQWYDTYDNPVCWSSSYCVVRPEGQYTYRYHGEHYDQYDLHRGRPRISIRFNKKVTGKIKIVYYTVFDKTPDVYINYAKFRLSIDGIEHNIDDLKSWYIYNDDIPVGKGMDLEHYGKDWWNNKAPQVTCPADLFTSSQSNGRCWQADWSVWANAVKPWGNPEGTGSGVNYWENDLSGKEDIHGKTITIKDTLQPGWKVDTTSIKGYIGLPYYKEDGTIDPDRHDVRLMEIKDAWKYLDGEPQYPDDLKSTGTFTIKLDMSQLAGDKQCTMDGKDVACTVKENEKAVIKFTYSSYLSVKAAVDNGYQYNQMATGSNTAEVSIGNKTAQHQAKGETQYFAAADDSKAFSKTLTSPKADSTGKVTLPSSQTLNYSIVLNDQNDINPINVFGQSDSITITDTLDARASFSEKEPVITVENNWNLHQNDGARCGIRVDSNNNPVIDADGNEQRDCLHFNNTSLGSGYSGGTSIKNTMPFTSRELSVDPATGKKVMRFTMPNFVVVGPDWYTDPNTHQTVRNVYTRIPLTEAWRITVKYDVIVNDIMPGETIDGFSNHATMERSTYSSDYTIDHLFRSAFSSDISMGASASLVKTDSQTGDNLQGARFMLDEVADLSDFYSDGTMMDSNSDEYKAAARTYATHVNTNDGLLPLNSDRHWQTGDTTPDGQTQQYLISGTDGRITLPTLTKNKLYVLRETTAPTGYARETKPRYFIYTDYITLGTDPNSSQFYELRKLVSAINSAPAKEGETKRTITMLMPTSGTSILPVSNDATQSLQWHKFIGDDSTIDEQHHTVSDMAMLEGTEWTVSTKDASACTNTLSEAGPSLLPCTVQVIDNNKDGAENTNGYYTQTDENGTITAAYLFDANPESGVIHVENLRSDVEYTLTETHVPEGYMAKNDSYTFTIADDGTITWKGDTQNQPFTITSQGANTPVQYAIANYHTYVMPSAGSTGPSRIARMLGMTLLVLSAGYTVYLMRKREQSPLSLS